MIKVILLEVSIVRFVVGENTVFLLEQDSRIINLVSCARRVSDGDNFEEQGVRHTNLVDEISMTSIILIVVILVVNHRKDNGAKGDPED